ncbi:MAG TPA: 2TM domain-containing protein [Flavisolibacter sp.]|jgi:hypothetical protein|nr:2TM domain-containing protein [Flavisolibacter sp.]
MSYTFSTPEGRDPHIWRMAQARAAFKRHFIIYLIMSSVFWAIWYFTGGVDYTNDGLPWPVWPMFGWGIGLLFHYLGAYRTPINDPAEKEYQKIIQKQNKK